MILGAHRSTAGGVWKAAESGREIGCDAIQVFTRAPQQWSAKPLDSDDRQRFRQACRDCGISAVLAHDIYLTNLATSRADIREKSIASFKDEIARCEVLGIPWLVTHCGAHDETGEQAGTARVGDALKECLDSAATDSVTVLLEGTAGQGSALGWRFEQLAQLLTETARPERTGICLDTCHMFAAGYDIRTTAAYEEVMRAFDDTVGIERLRAVHANDAKKPLGSRVDRHERLGEGQIGREGFSLLINDPRMADIPIVVETPDLDRHKEDLEFLRGLKTG